MHPVKLSKIITLTTDFGLEDEYAGVMKGVILSKARDVTLVDITHAVTPGNILEGQFYIMHSFKYFPEGTVHVGVIDPGVGTERKAIVVLYANHYFVGPDNGIFTFAIEGGGDVMEIDMNSDVILRPLSSTFHGRDVFAPVAGYIASGGDISRILKPMNSPVKKPVPEPSVEENRMVGEILFFDRFGNAVTSIPWERGIKYVRIPEINLNLNPATCYADVGPKSAVAVPGSRGFLEISVNMGNAKEELGLRAGMDVIAFLQ